MTDRIKQMAQEAGIDIDSDTLCRHEGWSEPMRKFAALVAEDCARVADERLTSGRSPMGKVAAAAIRARYPKPD